MRVTSIPSDLYQKYAGIKLRNSSMNKLNINFFYDFGSHLNPIVENIAEEKNAIDIILHAYYVKDALESLFKAFPWMDVCKNAAPELVSAIDECLKAFNESRHKKDGNGKQKYIPSEFHVLREKAQAFQTVLAAELRTLEAYVTTQKAGYHTTDLIEHAEIILPESVLSKIDDRVINEIRSSGRCLVFDSPTASGFHILRATELVLHQYYLAICKPNCDDELESWSAYISALNRASESNPDIKKTVMFLQLLKNTDRNSIMHPEVVLTPDQALTLFDTAKAVIMVMSEKLSSGATTNKHERKRKGTPKT